MRFIRENSALAAGIILPLLFIAIFAVVNIIPQLLVPSPQYGLLLTTQVYGKRQQNQEINIEVVDGSLRANARSLDKDHALPGSTLLYYFNPENNELREISIPLNTINTDTNWQPVAIPEAQNWKISRSPTAPDGYVFDKGKNHYSPGGLFLGGYRNSLSIAKDGRNVAISSPASTAYFNEYNAEFLGWVVSK